MPASSDPTFALPRPTGRRRASLHLLFFLLSAYTILSSGASPFLDRPDQFVGLPGVFLVILDLEVLARGVPYAAWLLAILGCHEMGHYLACRRYRIDATPPLFLPGPTMPFGTFGAFIRIRSPFPDRRALFDVGIAGPLAGLAVTVAGLWVGYARSTVVPAGQPGTIELGDSLLTLAMARWAAPSVPEGYDLLLHPAAYAGWVGALATALNLLPIGQLDGGHVAYAASRRLHRRASIVAAIVLGLLGLAYLGWAFWGLVLMLLMGPRHPPLVDESAPLSPGRRLLALLGLVALAICFPPVPFGGLSGG
jgi:membrane-associated protease RseP (regulator of RpoE activity)